MAKIDPEDWNPNPVGAKIVEAKDRHYNDGTGIESWGELFFELPDGKRYKLFADGAYGFKFYPEPKE